MPLTPRTLARAGLVAATAAAACLAGAVAPAGADPSSVSNVVSTAAGSGAARLDATCHFGPVVPDNFEDQMVVTGVATAPGAVSTTVRCTFEDYWGDDGGPEATADGSVATLSDTVPHWRSAVRVCVSAEADFGGTLGGVLVAQRVCS